MQASLGAIDIGILVLYAAVLVGMGFYFLRLSRTSEQFMVAGRSIPAWAAGLAVMSTYTSSISYIATPGKAFQDNWHPIIFSVCIIPVAWLTCKYVVPYYRKSQIISVYKFLEERLGAWARIYASFSFLLYMIGRVAVILYLASLLLQSFIPWSLPGIILIIGVVTIVYTLTGGMQAVIWTDVMQSAIMIVGIIFCAVALSMEVFSGSDPLIRNAVEQNKFSWGSWDLNLADRTIWVMIIYGITENLRNLMADQNYVQKYSSVGSESDAKRSIWIAMLIYIPLTAIFLYIGTILFAFYSGEVHQLPEEILTADNVGDRVFPYYIATMVPTGLKGLIIAAILAAAMSTVDSALNCSATVYLLDFHKRFFRPEITEEGSIYYLRLMTVIWGVLGIGGALFMIKAKSALDVWWQISGIFGGGILGLFLLSLFRVRLQLWQGLVAIAASVIAISWATFARNLPEDSWIPECTIDGIIIGAFGTIILMIPALIFGFLNRTEDSASA